MLQWLVLAAVVAAHEARRRVRLRVGERYRYLQEFKRVTDAEVQQIATSQGWKLMQRKADRALFAADVVVGEAAELDVPSNWVPIAGVGFVDDNDTDGSWRVLDVRAAEV